MARKTNFRFERQERERIQAEKRAARDALKEQRKAESAAEAVEAPASAPVAMAPTPAGAGPSGPAASSAQASAAIKALETMTPAEIAILHQNAVRLASTGSPKQRAAAQELLPRLEAELQRLDEAKRQAAAARLASATKRPKKE